MAARVAIDGRSLGFYGGIRASRLCGRGAGRLRDGGGLGWFDGRLRPSGLTAAAIGTVGGEKGGGKGVVDVANLAFGNLLGVVLREEGQLTEIAESGGATSGNLIGGKSFEDALEGRAHIEVGVRAKKVGDIAFEVFFDLGAAKSLHAAVGLAVAIHDGGHAALASVGKEEVAEVKGRGLRAAGHFLHCNIGLRVPSNNYIEVFIDESG
jgi:hypothetical protein